MSGQNKQRVSRIASGAVLVLLAVALPALPSHAEDATAQCDSGWACIFENRDWNHPDGVGRVLQFRDCDLRGDSNCDWQMLDVFNFNDELSSWRNKKSDDAKWDWHWDGSGADRCMESISSLAYVGDGDNDEASAVKVFNRDDVC